MRNKGCKFFSFVFLCIGLIMTFCFPAAAAFDSAQVPTHKIGVLVYNITADEVRAFREYLTQYVAEVFPDVEFVYSESISSREQELEFIQDASDAGVEGILSFLTYDLQAEVALCEENEIYYIMASSTVSDEDFENVKNSPWFLGVIGPGTDTEYQAGYEMASYFAESEPAGYFILSGGGAIGNEMHYQRALGMLESLEAHYGESFDRDVTELALSEEMVETGLGDVPICIFPGYLSQEANAQGAAQAYASHPYPVVLGTLALYEIRDDLRGAKVGMVDCYSENNLQAVSWGNLSYLVGKYASLIGPSFAAMYNAITGYAADFRDDGQAFRLHQGFWVSADPNDYVEKYTLSSSLAVNAYNYEDLMSMCKVYNSEADLKMLEMLAESCGFEEVKNRRGL